MRPLGFTAGNNYQPGPSDTLAVAVISTAGAVVSFDHPPNARYVRFGSTGVFYLNMRSAAVTIPTTTATPSTGNGTLLNPGQDQSIFSIDPTSTGLSLTAPSSGVITAEYWGQ